MTLYVGNSDSQSMLKKGVKIMKSRIGSGGIALVKTWANETYAFHLLCAIVLVVAIAGCREAPPQVEQRNSAKLVAKSTGEIEKLFSSGMSTNEIVARVGIPSWSEAGAGGGLVWTYDVTPFDLDERGDIEVSAIVVFVTNGHLAGWGYNFADKSPSGYVVQNERSFSVEAGNLPSLSFYAVHDAPLASGQFIDTTRFPKLGFISSTPDLTISRLVEVSLEERKTVQDGEEQNQWAFRFKMGDDDAERFKILTTANVFKRVAVMIGDEVVTSPMISSPIHTGIFEINFNDRTEMEYMRDKLNRTNPARKQD